MESETDTEEDTHQGTAQGPDVASCRRRARLRQVDGHLMSCSSSATSASLLEHRALRTLATKKTSPATTRALPDLCCQTQFAHSGRDADGDALIIYSSAQHIFGCTGSLGQHTDGCPHAQVSPILQTRRCQATKISPVSGAGNCSLLVAREKLSPLSLRTRQLVPPTSSVTSHEKMDNARAWLGNGATGWKTSRPFCTRKTGKLAFFVPPPTSFGESF